LARNPEIKPKIRKHSFIVLEVGLKHLSETAPLHPYVRQKEYDYIGSVEREI
jgi:hypothetical protein